MASRDEETRLQQLKRREASLATQPGRDIELRDVRQQIRDIKSGHAGGRAAAQAKAEAAKLRTQLAQEQNKRERRKKDIREGQAFAKEVLPEGSLGRVDEERSEDVADIIARRRDQLEGFSAEELQAERDIAARQIARAGQTAQRQLAGRQAATGVRGGTAGAQQALLQRESIQQRRQFEQELFLRQAQERSAALDRFERSVTGAEATEESRQKFNLQQAASEKFAELSTALGFAQLGVAERGGERAADAQRAAASAQSSCFAIGTLVLDAEGNKKRIEDFRLGEGIKGGVVTAIHVALSEDIYLYKGVKVAGSHAVKTEDGWKRVRDIEGLDKLYTATPQAVINLGTSNHRIYTEQAEWGDFFETDSYDNVTDTESLEILNKIIDKEVSNG